VGQLLHVVLLVSFFFFFQAEDGIRDSSVTGVQTCALPISSAPSDRRETGRGSWACRSLRNQARRRADIGEPSANTARLGSELPRSEERRVGKECRSGGWQ